MADASKLKRLGAPPSLEEARADLTPERLSVEFLLPYGQGQKPTQRRPMTNSTASTAAHCAERAERCHSPRASAWISTAVSGASPLGTEC